MGSSIATSALFKPLKIGKNTLSNRLVMAPLTRFRSDDSHVPVPMMATYYAQRASTPGTLLITEATFISPRASGYANAPGIWNSDQITAWKQVTDAVHAQGSYIYLQLWALGRAATKDVIEREFGKEFPGIGVVSSSATPMVEGKSTVPRALEESEILEYIKDYAQAAKNAVEGAGFDGVEIHGANGYLIDQFTQDNSNKRTDAWGGSIENRSRFGLEVAKAVVEAVGPERVGIRLSPFNTFQGMRMKDPIPQFTHLINGLKKLNLSYLHITENWRAELAASENPDRLDFALEAWGNTSPVLIAGGFEPETARERVDEKLADKDIAIVFGRYYISNPDLVYRIQNDIPLRPFDIGTFYTPKSEVGYIDYQFSPQFQEGQKESRL